MPDVDPIWLSVDTESPTAAVENRKKVSRALSNVSSDDITEMGSTQEDMVVDCMFGGYECDTRYWLLLYRLVTSLAKGDYFCGSVGLSVCGQH